MKHLVLTQFGTPSESVTLRDDPDPTPGPNDVLVRMEAAAVNPSDLLMLQGRYFARPEPPAPAGGEGVGIVVDTGAQADGDLLGKRVVVLPTYKYGTWAEKVVVPQDKVAEVAANADPLQLAMLPINPATAHVMLKRFVDLEPGDWVAQPGANSAVGRAGLGAMSGRGSHAGHHRRQVRADPPVPRRGPARHRGARASDHSREVRQARHSRRAAWRRHHCDPGVVESVVVFGPAVTDAFDAIRKNRHAQTNARN
jgi:Alcohol dehydrogenase GroES-like domain